MKFYRRFGEGPMFKDYLLNRKKIFLLTVLSSPQSRIQTETMEFDNMQISTNMMDYIFKTNMRSKADTQLEYVTLRSMYVNERSKFVLIFPLHTSNNEALHHITFDVVVNEKWTIRLHLYVEFRGNKIVPLYLTKSRDNVYIDFRILLPPPGLT